MKKMRKLLPALAMLIVSAVLMSTASFAWFSTNTTATAEGMTVTVSSANNLLISDESNGTYKSSVDFNQNIAALEPASAVAALAPSFFKIDEAGDQMTAESAEYKDSTFKAAVAGTDYIKTTAYIKAIGDDLDGYYVVPTITIADSNVSPVYKSYRVLLVVTDLDSNEDTRDEAAYYIYAPVTGADTTAKPIKAIDPTVTEDSTAPSFSTSGTTKIVDEVKKENIYQIDIYVWLEGQDSNCKAANAINIVENDISVAFTIAKAQQQQ